MHKCALSSLLKTCLHWLPTASLLLFLGQWWHDVLATSMPDKTKAVLHLRQTATSVDVCSQSHYLFIIKLNLEIERNTKGGGGGGGGRDFEKFILPYNFYLFDGTFPPRALPPPPPPPRWFGLFGKFTHTHTHTHTQTHTPSRTHT